MADTLELIKSLPTELREQILKEYIKIKLWQRKMLGWGEVHKVIKKAPVKNEQIVVRPFCYKAFCRDVDENSCPECREIKHGIRPLLHKFIFGEGVEWLKYLELKAPEAHHEPGDEDYVHDEAQFYVMEFGLSERN